MQELVVESLMVSLAMVMLDVLVDDEAQMTLAAHGTGPRARRLQDIESDTGYDTRRRVPDGARARVSQTERAFAPGAQLGRGVRSSSAVKSSIG